MDSPNNHKSASDRHDSVREYSLQDVARMVNNVNLDEEIVVVDGWHPAHGAFPTPMRVNAMLIILCTRGSGHVGIDLREYEVKEDTLVVIQPKNYIHLSEYEPDSEANIVACSKHVVEDVLPKLTDLFPLLLHHRTEPVTYLTTEESAAIKRYFRFLHEIMCEPSTPFLQRKVMCILQASLFEMMDIHHRRQQSPSYARSRKEEIMARFIISVSENFRAHREVLWYAQKLCISSKHLSAVAKETSGRTAGEWIENYVTMEAKMLLKTTDLTIQQISAQLNFANQSFFGKYFKNQTGMSPTDYRRENA